MSVEDPTHKSRRYSKLFLVCAEVIPLLSWMLTQSFRSSKGRGGHCPRTAWLLPAFGVEGLSRDYFLFSETPECSVEITC